MIDIEVYEFQFEATFSRFQFTSEGKNGKIEKVVVFTPAPVPDVYNLGFGDADFVAGTINTNIVSNNGDTDKVLATVANTIIEFTAQNPNATIFAIGVTPARNRLYRMNIQKYWTEISTLFEILGHYQNAWENFIPNRDYQAFLIKRKII